MKVRVQFPSLVLVYFKILVNSSFQGFFILKGTFEETVWINFKKENRHDKYSLDLG